MDTKRLIERLEQRQARVGVIGLGYVGLPLCNAFAQAGFKVLGFDIDPTKIKELEAGRSYIDAVPSEAVAKLRQEELLRATTDFSRVKELDAVAICVPTPLTQNQDPDTSYIEITADAIGPHLPDQGILIVLESTTYPGTTRDLLGPRLEKASGGRKKAGRDFLLAFSPERENPGSTWRTDRIPKVVGADDAASREAVAALYRQAVVQIVPVSSSAAAEATKLLENIYRCVNIALVNELKVCFDRMGIDIFEVIEAAKTKPFGFQAFYPGPGLGGHCLHGRETAWIRDHQGVRALPCQDLFEKAATLGVTRRADGVEVVEPIGLEALSFDVESREPIFSPITHLFRRRSSEPLLRFRTADNRLLTVTAGHPMLTWNGYSLEQTRADAIAIGDELPLLTSWPDEDREWNDTIDLVEIACRQESTRVRVQPKRGSWSDHDEVVRAVLRALHLGVAAKDVYRHDTLPLEAFLELERRGESPFGRDEVVLATGRGSSFTVVPALVKIDESFARLIGYYLSEGCITRDKSLRIRFCFGAHERELIEDTRSILDNLGIRSSEHRLRTCETVHVKVSSTLLAVLLRDVLGCGVRSEDASIPARLLGAPPEIRAAVLSGLLRGDGDVDASSRYRSYRKNGRSYNHWWNSAKVGFFTSSPILYQQVIGLVQGLGLIPTFHKNRPHMKMAGPQIDRLEPLMAGAKADRMKVCREGRK